MKITVNHARQLDYCSRGIRRFFKQYKLDLRDFLKNGIEEEVLLKTNDPHALKLIEHAKTVSSNG